MYRRECVKSLNLKNVHPALFLEGFRVLFSIWQGWKQKWSKEYCCYFYVDRQTGASTYERPVDQTQAQAEVHSAGADAATEMDISASS